MKLIIDIPEEAYEYVKTTSDYLGVFAKAIKNGTPLDDVKAEIKEKISHYDHFQSSNTANGLNIALEIIDKHIGRKRGRMSDTVKLIIEIDKKTVAHIRSHYGHGCKGMYDDDRDRIVDAIYNATPLDDVRENIHGEWLKHSCYKGVLICSNCNHGSNMYDKDFNFCPNCGADMRKESSL